MISLVKVCIHLHGYSADKAPVYSTTEWSPGLHALKKTLVFKKLLCFSIIYLYGSALRIGVRPLYFGLNDLGHNHCKFGWLPELEDDHYDLINAATNMGADEAYVFGYNCELKHTILPIPPSLGTPNLIKLQTAEPPRCLVLRTRDGSSKSSVALDPTKRPYPFTWITYTSCTISLDIVR